MEDHPDADDIVKVEMQDVYPSSRQPTVELNTHGDQSPISTTSRLLMDPSRASHYEHVNSMNDQNAISVEQRAAAIMDRIKQVGMQCIRRIGIVYPLRMLEVVYK